MAYKHKLKKKKKELLHKSLNSHDYTVVVFICKCYNYYVVSALRPGESMKVPEKNQHIVFSRQSERNVTVFTAEPEEAAIRAVP